MTSSDSMDSLLTVQETAARLRSHPETVRKLLRRGDLTGLKFPSANRGGTWKIRKSAIADFLKRNEYKL